MRTEFHCGKGFIQPSNVSMKVENSSPVQDHVIMSMWSMPSSEIAGRMEYLVAE